MSDTYRIPDLLPGQIIQAEQIIHRSRFIVTLARVQNVDEAKAFIDSIRTRYADATHNCWAYTADKPGSTTHIGASDDGEPKGTAGRPMLTVLLHCGIGEVAAVVTRYYGGILLGTGGLVRAYQGLVKLGLDQLPTRELEPSRQISLTLEHRHLNIALRAIEQARGQILNKTFMSDVTLDIVVPLTTQEALIQTLTEKTAGALLVENSQD